MTEIITRELTADEIAEREAWEAGAYDRAVAEVKAQREAAYRSEADPLFFKSQRGKATKQEWLDKVAEIKARYPDPEPPKKVKK